MTPHARPLIVTLCAALALGLPLLGCEDDPPPEAESVDSASPDARALEALQADLDRIVAEQSGAAGLPGIGVTISLGTGEVLTASAGRVGPAPDAPDYSAHETAQVIGSVTKLFTATAVMQRVERGELALDARLDHWFEFEGAGDITVQMLLDHTAGLADYLQLMPPERMGEDWSPEALIDLAVQADPYAAPGGPTAWYSNTHYVLLARIVEATSGRSWAAEIEAAIAAPLGLSGLGYAGAPDRQGAFADGWYLDGAEWGASLDVIHPSIGWGVGALVASGHDLARFGRALFDGELFEDPATLERMLRFERPLAERLYTPGEPPQSLGLGVIRYDLGGGAAIDGHFGWVLGYQAGLFHDPSTDAVIAISANVDGIHVGLAALAVADALRVHLAP